MQLKVRLCRHRVATDQLPSVADFLIAVMSVSTQGRHTPAIGKHEVSTQGPLTLVDENKITYSNAQHTIPDFYRRRKIGGIMCANFWSDKNQTCVCICVYAHTCMFECISIHLYFISMNTCHGNHILLIYLILLQEQLEY